jgi:hypothetical protein
VYLALDCSPLIADIESVAAEENFSGFVEVRHERNLPAGSVRRYRDRLHRKEIPRAERIRQ